MADTEPASSLQQQRLTRLNALWRVAGPEPTTASMPQRLLFEVRSIVARLLRPQETFNASTVEYLNDLSATVAALARHVEALEVRARRVETGFGALEELRRAVGVLQQTTQTLRREMQSGGAQSETATHPAEAPVPGPGALDNDSYVGFEDAFRGDPAAIRARLADYVPVFAGTSDVLDVGCGRGEFLALLGEAGIAARGVDINPSMVQVCRDRGLPADTGDALGALRAVPDTSLGGLFAAQVVEHLEPGYLSALLRAAFDKLRPGAPIVLETINPACWFAFFEGYLRDITHVRALHPETLQFLLVASGFQRVEISYREPYPEADKLQTISPNPAIQTAINTLNQNVQKLNGLLFTWLDYAVIGYRP